MEPHVEEVRPTLAAVRPPRARAPADPASSCLQFEKKILREADEFSEKVRSRRASDASSRRNSTSSSRRPSRRSSSSSGANPLLSGLAGGQFGMSKMTTKEPTPASGNTPKDDAEPTNLESINDRLANLDVASSDRMAQLEADPFEDDSDTESDFDLDEYTEEEIGCRNKSVRILPGVRRLIDSLPSGRFAVATSGAKTCTSSLSDPNVLCVCARS